MRGSSGLISDYLRFLPKFLSKKNVHVIKKSPVCCFEFILNSREVFSCYDIHIINIYSGSKPIYCISAYKLPQTALFWSNPFVAKGSILSIHAFAVQLRRRTFQCLPRRLSFFSSFSPTLLVSLSTRLSPSCSKNALHMKDRLQKRVNECKVHFRFEMYLKSDHVCKVFQFSFTHHFFFGLRRREIVWDRYK